MPSKMRGGVARLGGEPGRPTALPRRAGFRLLQFGQPALVRPGPRQAVEFPQPAQLGGVGPDHVVARRRPDARQPAGPQPAPHRVPARSPAAAPGPPGRYSSGPSPAGLPCGSRRARPRWHDQPQHHLPGEPVGPLRRPEALGVEPLGDRRRAQPLAAQRPQPLDQPRVVGLQVVTRSPAGTGCATRPAPPTQCSSTSTRSLALSTVTHHPLDQAAGRSAAARRAWSSAACHTAGRSAASDRIARSSSGESRPGAVRCHRSYSSSSCRCALQRLLPAPLQLAADQPVLRLARLVLPGRPIDLVPRPAPAAAASAGPARPAPARPRPPPPGSPPAPPARRPPAPARRPARRAPARDRLWQSGSP